MSSKEQQPSPQVGGAGKQTHWFISDIQLMMHGLGDCCHPLQESASLVEELTQHQMHILVYKAADVAYMRAGKILNVEDILFLMRKDKVKLRRLLRYLHLKDMKASLNRNSSVEDNEDAIEPVDAKPQPCGKRRKICYDFLSSIDQTGELLDLFDDESEDDVKYERLMRADLQSRCLDPQQYLEYSVARQANFGRKHKSQKFKDWVFSGVTIDIKPTQHAMEIIAYLAYETVAQIVDLALLVKQDIQTGSVDLLSQTLPCVSHNMNQTATMFSVMGQTQSKLGLTSPTVSPPTTPVPGQNNSLNSSTGSIQSSSSKSKSKKKKKSSHAHPLEIPLVKAIQPSDIQEAMRRYCAFVGPFASELKFNSMLKSKLIMLSI